ncbi:hypothetical protein [Aquimarina algiphila]|uniref:Uncharacterized protein n=1 Tax=Aquimarina algiphila TaxID=2047982 RepID=A0A554VE33_9FLAO|nr:hypothetical protein [Aquimarina algiphila]TSE05249.1 hypothetical protein FOF46_23585 [Aquimarina algiphila]
MAKQGRSGLNGLVNSLVPDNLIKFITAFRMRNVLKDYRDSHFNLTDDDMYDVNFNNLGTGLTSTNAGDAIIEINNKVRPFLGGGTIRFGDIGGEPNGTPIAILDGTFTQCTAIQDAGVDIGSIYEVRMEDIGTDQYQVLPTIIYNGNFNNKVYFGTTGVKTATKFNFFMGEARATGISQNVDLELILIKKFG